MAEGESLDLEELDDMDMAAAIAAEQQEKEEQQEQQAATAPKSDDAALNVPRAATDLEAVYDVPVNVSAVLGKSTMQVSQLLKLGRGAVVELDRKVGEAIDIYVNDRLVARGEVVVVEDRLGVTMTEIVKGEKG
jgi:flagellar motor switch protein FliN/FliY